MKLLLITNLFPFPNNPTGGSFITNRLEVLQDLSVDFDVYSVTFHDGFGLRFLKKVLSKEMNFKDSSFNAGRIEYKYMWIDKGLIDAFEFFTLYQHSQKEISKRFANKLFNIVKDEGFDVIHAHGMYYPSAGLIANMLSRKLGIPYVITCHGGDINYEMPKAKEIYIDVLENAAKVIFVSNALLNKAKLFGYSGENSIVIPNGIEPSVFKPLDKEKIKKDLGLSKKVVGFVGNLINVKRADKFPEIFYNISSIYDSEFLVIGDGELRSRIENECKKKGLKVKFVGRVPHDKVSYYMNAMDVLILPSRNEGWPCVVLEAQGCGVPVVGSNNGGIPEAIGDGGIVVEEGEDFEKRFAQSVVKFLEDPIDESHLVRRAKDFSWKSIVGGETTVYKEVLN